MDLESSDAATAQQAQVALPRIFAESLPNIERDSQVICTALHSPNAEIRLKASAILVGIMTGAPQHASVVAACNERLLDTAADPDDDVRNNALFLLAMNPNGVTQAGHDAFMRAFSYANYRTAELGAVGLLNEESVNKERNRALVQGTLEATADLKVRLNLLYAIAGSRAHSDGLFEAARRSLNSTDKDTALAAIDAMVASSTSTEQLEASITSVASDPGTPSEVKSHVKAVMERIVHK